MNDSQIRAQLVKKGALAPTSTPCGKLSDAQCKASMAKAIAARQHSFKSR
jgi:hypothetical protein